MLSDVLLHLLPGQHPICLRCGVLSDDDDLFSDRATNHDIRKSMPDKEIRMEQILQNEAQAVWAEFRQLPDRARY